MFSMTRASYLSYFYCYTAEYNNNNNMKLGYVHGFKSDMLGKLRLLCSHLMLHMPELHWIRKCAELVTLKTYNSCTKGRGRCRGIL